MKALLGMAGMMAITAANMAMLSESLLPSGPSIPRPRGGHMHAHRRPRGHRRKFARAAKQRRRRARA